MPLLDALEAWLRARGHAALAQVRDGQAVACILTRWDGLTLFADDGRIEMDGNLVESRVRPLALGRKNALSAGHDDGPRNRAPTASLISTCKTNGV